MRDYDAMFDLISRVIEDMERDIENLVELEVSENMMRRAAADLNLMLDIRETVFAYQDLES